MATNAKKRKRVIELQKGLEVPQIDVLTDLLIRERKSVLFVGEGDFSFTVAFAALRESGRSSSSSPDLNPGTWDGIVATRYDPKHGKSKPKFSQVVNTCKESCQHYHRAHPGSTQGVKIEILSNLARRPSNSWKYNIDARHFKNHKEELEGVEKDVIWFQCPWSGDQRPRSGEKWSTYHLICSFLGSASHILQPGDHVCVGISKDRDYVHQYNPAELTQKHPKDDILQRYEFQGADDKLVKRVCVLLVQLIFNSLH